MNKVQIDEALSYYEITDHAYNEKCYKCLEYITNNKKLQKEFNKLYEILFIDKTDKIRELWNIKSLDKLFVEKTPEYITNLLLLSGYKIHQRNQNQYNLDDEQIKIHKLRVKESLINDIKLRKYNQIRLSQMLWGAYFVNIRLIEVGRLQYEKCEKFIKIHIPSNGKLDMDKVKESLSNSKFYIERYFGLKDYNYYCNSWLLSNQIHNMLDKDSNIHKFYNLFNIDDGESCIDDVLNFVYQQSEINNYSELAENTSLQRKLKQFLLNGNDIKIGKGMLKNEENVSNRL